MATKEKTTKKNAPTIPVVEVDDSLKERYHVINIDGDKYRTLYTESYKKRVMWVKPDIKKIYSEIPGTVIKIYVTVGQEVKEGELMLVLEAMKMKNKLLFPIDGVVKKIYISENEKIPKKTLMVELE